jgi:Hydantoinase B/oxoprolinase
MNISTPKIDSALLAVISHRFDCICREMTNTLLRSGRSAVLNMARDFSCSLVTGDNQLLAAAEGLPVHVFGSQFQSQAMCDLHHDLAEGDAFIHNDVYLGNTHSADHTILVPVFVDGAHLFTACAKVSTPGENYISGQSKNASVGGGQWEWWLASGRGSARGIAPSLMQRITNVVEPRAARSYPGSRGG